MSESEFSGAAELDDLRWWLDLAPTLEWIWAKTFADSAPHWYVVHGRTKGMTMDDFVRAGRVIRTFGEPGKFYRSTNLYLHTQDRTKKFWAMWGDRPRPEDADLINMATTDRVYGPQDDINEERVETLHLRSD